MKYRKRPVVIDAVQWAGTEQCMTEVLIPFVLDGKPDFSHLPNNGQMIQVGIGFTPPDGKAYIPTLEGDMAANPGDWIIKGVKGEFYPCKPDIFEATYEKVDDAK